MVKKQGERVLLPCEYTEKPPENRLKTVLRLLRRRLRNRWLSTDHKLQRGNEVDDKLTVGAQRIAQCVPPPAKLRLALPQKRAHKTLEGLCQRCVRDRAFGHARSAGRECPTRRDEHLVQLVHH